MGREPAGWVAPRSDARQRRMVRRLAPHETRLRAVPTFETTAHWRDTLTKHRASGALAIGTELGDSRPGIAPCRDRGGVGRNGMSTPQRPDSGPAASVIRSTRRAPFPRDGRELARGGRARANRTRGSRHDRRVHWGLTPNEKSWVGGLRDWARGGSPREIFAAIGSTAIVLATACRCGSRKRPRQSRAAAWALRAQRLADPARVRCVCGTQKIALRHTASVLLAQSVLGSFTTPVGIGTATTVE